ncbi:glycosyltransferase [Microbacteriaceae bacterium 4G12]
MKVLHINAGAEEGGGKTHIISILSQFNKEEVELAVFEDGVMASEARALGIKVHVFSQSSRYDIFVLSKLVTFINKEKFDIIHTHGARANFFVSLIKGRIKAKWITTVHSDPKLDFMKRGLKGWIFTKLNLRSFQKADLFFAITENFKQNLIQLGIPDKKIRVIYNGIRYDKERTTPYNKKEIGIEENIFTIIQVARLHPVKGHEILLDALQKVHTKKLQVLLVGDGPAEQELKAKVQELRLSHKVFFLGHRTDVNRLYASADISLLTSYSESFPIVLLEAANQHIPCITTNVGDMKKLVPDDSYGWIIPIGDSDALAKALDEAYDKWRKCELSSMGERLYEHASKNFSLQKLYGDTYQVYKELV